MSPHIDTRIIRILRWLLDQEGPRSTAALAEDLGLSQRVVRYRLGAAEAYLRANGLELVKQRGSGVWIDGPGDVRAALQAELAEVGAAPKVYAPEERDHLLLAALLWAAPESTSLDRLQDQLEVSKASARRDLRRCEPWLARRGLPVVRTSGVGISVPGTESSLRHAMVQLVVEAVPEDVLAELATTPLESARLMRVKVPAGMQERLATLPIGACAQLLSDRPFSGALTEGRSELVLAVYLAVVAARLREGKTISLEPGQHRSLTDHPVAATAAAIARSFEKAFDCSLPEQEIAGITEYLLGLATVSSAERVEAAQHEALVDEMLRVASERLHPTLGDDQDLRRSLDEHLTRLEVRLRYGLPVHNPLLEEVAARYPDVFEVASGLGEIAGKYFAMTIGEDEIGYLTMYLSGALERSRLLPGRRAIVICPSGMATAWVLVSRIKAEFPQLELVNVLSARALAGADAENVDVIISTVEVQSDQAPVVVVSPLLTPADIRAVSRIVMTDAWSPRDRPRSRRRSS